MEAAPHERTIRRKEYETRGNRSESTEGMGWNGRTNERTDGRTDRWSQSGFRYIDERRKSTLLSALHTHRDRERERERERERKTYWSRGGYIYKVLLSGGPLAFPCVRPFILDCSSDSSFVQVPSVLVCLNKLRQLTLGSGTPTAWHFIKLSSPGRRDWMRGVTRTSGKAVTQTDTRAETQTRKE